jgi:hypothetical protein
MIADRLNRALEQSVTGGNYPFQTYGAFGKQNGLSENVRTWARRNVLDTVARQFTSTNKLDLTFLLFNSKTKYPSVIDGKPSNPPSPQQKARAHAVAQQIINTYCPGTKNPYQ